VGLFHWIFGKHPPRPPDPERTAVAALVSSWEAPLVADALQQAGIAAALNDDHTSYLWTGAIDAKVQVHVMEPDVVAARKIIAAVIEGRSNTPGLRPAVAADRELLRALLVESWFVPDGAPADQDPLDAPQLHRLVDGFGSHPDDIGWIALDGTDAPIGAAWLRRWDAPDAGSGFVDAATPELTIAVPPARRGSGIGSALLATALDEVGRCSLGVDRRNPAVTILERFGFAVVEQRGDTLVMLADPEPGRP
jgi:GNAT superfamily N-acetyltransferase